MTRPTLFTDAIINRLIDGGDDLIAKCHPRTRTMMRSAVDHARRIRADEERRLSKSTSDRVTLRFGGNDGTR
jgi:hypothetical protein